MMEDTTLKEFCRWYFEHYHCTAAPEKVFIASFKGHTNQIVKDEKLLLRTANNCGYIVLEGRLVLKPGFITVKGRRRYDVAALKTKNKRKK